MSDPDYLKHHYSNLVDEELLRLARGELLPEARALLETETRSRGLDERGVGRDGSYREGSVLQRH